MAKPSHTGAEMRVFYPVFRRQELALGRHRARYLTARLPMPPVRPVRETFTSYGSRERGVYRKRPFRHLHGTFTGVSLRVRWVPLYHFPPLSLRAFAMCAVFPCSDYYAQFDCLQGLGDFGTGLPCLLPTLLAIPFRLSRVHRGELKRDAVGGVLLNVPSTLCGSLVVIWGRSGLPISPFESANYNSHRAYSCACGSLFQIDEPTSQARYVRGLFSRRTMHASCESPWHLSAKPCVLETCLLLTGPFRAMLLTS